MAAEPPWVPWTNRDRPCAFRSGEGPDFVHPLLVRSPPGALAAFHSADLGTPPFQVG